MKAIRFEKFGGPEVLEYKDIEIGKPGPNEVLVKNLSIGLNFRVFPNVLLDGFSTQEDSESSYPYQGRYFYM